MVNVREMWKGREMTDNGQYLSHDNVLRCLLLLLKLMYDEMFSDLDGMGSPEGMDSAMLSVSDLKYQTSAGCYSPKFSYGTFHDNRGTDHIDKNNRV